MPSIRVKRGYSTLQESPLLPAAEAPQADQPAQDAELRPSHNRRRSQTVTEGAITPGTRTLPRQPSRILNHIMSSTKIARPEARSLRHRASSVLSGVRRSFSRTSRDRSDMVSIEGRQEDILVPADPGHEPGRLGSALSIRPEDARDPFEEHHHDDIVEHLDVIDPQVATVSTLTNAANAIVIPPLSFYSRKPIVVLDAPPRSTKTDTEATGDQLPEDNLDRHVEDVLTRRDRFRRVMRGVWSFMKTPMGIIVTIYGFLIGLFSATSIGLIPFRVLDTYRISKIWMYKRRTRKLRAKAKLPELYDVDDLPDPMYDVNYVHVLTEEEQADLHYQQYKFMQSQTWYRPHGTQTHRAFPIGTALWICLLNDLNSIFQCLLSGCMWGLNRFERPAWTTATTLPAAFVCGILAGFYIYWGGRKTKRHEQVEQRLRAALAMEAPVDPPNSLAASTVQVDETQNRSRSLPLITTTSASTPALSASQTQDKDYAETTVSTDRESLASIPIADSMTVPPLEVLENPNEKI
ncbi:hypothetical protein NLI96_g2885 [Meripilus lineatus]|uniref:Uncharacterized protein n=1 Tax=Meripilus lineatus TaxID=2056292 RepID=A0AAD5YLG3_9APHY|nr:hypothetical protein NLI96_g2885 [Physisporinus lineatus]